MSEKEKLQQFCEEYTKEAGHEPEAHEIISYCTGIMVYQLQTQRNINAVLVEGASLALKELRDYEDLNNLGKSHATIALNQALKKAKELEKWAILTRKKCAGNTKR